MNKDVDALLAEVEALGDLFLKKDAEGEPWGKTCDRIERMARLARKIRRTQPVPA